MSIYCVVDAPEYTGTMAHMLTRPRPLLWSGLGLSVAAVASFALAALPASPWSLGLLLAGDVLCMSAVNTWLARRWSGIAALTTQALAYLLVLAAYTALVAALLGFPLNWLQQRGSLGAALGVSAAILICLLALWRIWPAVGMVYRNRPGQDAASVQGVVTRSLVSASKLTAHNEVFFGYGLVVAICLLLLAQGALSLAGIGAPITAAYRNLAVLAYALVLAPVASWVIRCCCLRAMFLDRRREHSRGVVEPASAHAVEPASAESEIPGNLSGARLNEMLLRCARAGQIQLAVAALARGADPDCVPPGADRDQRSVLVLAAVNPDLRLLRELVSRGADLNRSHAGLVPLLAATRDSHEGRPEAVMTLLTNGARPDCRDVDGNTPLHFAALAARPIVAALLCDAGAPLDAVNRSGQTPLSTACAAGNWEMARFLLQRGAKSEAERGIPALVAAASAPEDDARGVSLLLKHKARVNAQGPLGRSALMTAALHGHAQIAQKLVDAGANVDHADARGTTALMEASRAGALAVLDVLAAHRAKLDLADHAGRSALMIACQSERAGEDAVRRLLELGASTETALADGRRAVDLAAAAGRWNIVALIDPSYPRPASLAKEEPATGDPAAHLLDALRFGHWDVAERFAETVRTWPADEHARLFVELLDKADAATCRWQLRHGLDANSTTADGRTLLHGALARLPSAVATVRELLDAGAQVAGCNGALKQVCVAAGDADDRREELQALALAMLERGADTFAADQDNRAPLAHAVAAGMVQLVQALLARGVDPDSRDRHGRTPLFAALALPATTAEAMCRVLIVAGADPEIAADNGETALGCSLTRPASSLCNWLNWPGWKLPGRRLRPSDLVAAAACGDIAAVNKLLSLGLPINATDERGATALVRAAGDGHAALVARLLECGADASLSADTGATALTAAISAHQPRAVKTLIEHGAAVDQPLRGGITALMIAAGLGYADLVGELLAHAADVDAGDERGTRAVHAAAHYAFHVADAENAMRTLRCLLDAGADVNAPDHDGRSPLMLALGANADSRVAPDQERLLTLVRGLLEYGPDPNLGDKHGATALHICAMHGLLLPARELLAAGADPLRRDRLERCPHDVARMRGHVDLVALLAAPPSTDADKAWRAGSG